MFAIGTASFGMAIHLSSFRVESGLLEIAIGGILTLMVLPIGISIGVMQAIRQTHGISFRMSDFSILLGYYIFGLIGLLSSFILVAFPQLVQSAPIPDAFLNGAVVAAVLAMLLMVYPMFNEAGSALDELNQLRRVQAALFRERGKTNDSSLSHASSILERLYSHSEIDSRNSTQEFIVALSSEQRLKLVATLARRGTEIPQARYVLRDCLTSNVILAPSAVGTLPLPEDLFLEAAFQLRRLASWLEASGVKGNQASAFFRLASVTLGMQSGRDQFDADLGECLAILQREGRTELSESELFGVVAVVDMLPDSALDNEAVLHSLSQVICLCSRLAQDSIAPRSLSRLSDLVQRVDSRLVAHSALQHRLEICAAIEDMLRKGRFVTSFARNEFELFLRKSERSNMRANE